MEGHDWWPARVVRRRAVPREVGPPPGAPAYVRHHIPVVFFTRKGIPGEVDEGMDSATGALAACMRALKASGEQLGTTDALSQKLDKSSHYEKLQLDLAGVDSKLNP